MPTKHIHTLPVISTFASVVIHWYSLNGDIAEVFSPDELYEIAYMLDRAFSSEAKLRLLGSPSYYVGPTGQYLSNR